MRQRFNDYRVFWREFRQTFQSTGAILPSGRSLAKALASRVSIGQGPQRILEVGPGTGAVTSQVISRLRTDDHLDLVELNPRFASILRDRLVRESGWREFANQVRVLEMPIEELSTDKPYNTIVSGLPLNNFSYNFVDQIFRLFHQLAAPQAHLSFFEYVAIRKAKSLCSKRSERRRLTGIEQLLHHEFATWQVDRQCILANVPPAWVHHLCMPGTTNGKS